MSDIVSPNPFRALDRDGIPAPGALAYFYLSGTTTPQIVYSDQAGTVPHPVPLEADSLGVFPPIYSAVALRCTVTDASGTTLPGYPVDPVPIIPTGSGASQITFEPTGDIPETDVQAAIERVQQNLVEPLLDGGIGVTGNAPTLADIDATDTPSGAYRYTTGATGTFPAGVTAAAGGTIRLWRETAAEAVMELVARGSNVTWVRTMTASVWGAWQRMPLDSTATGRSILASGSVAAVRAFIDAPAAPKSGGFPGQWVLINPGLGVTAVVPGTPDQTWAYFVMGLNTGTVFTTLANVAAGGSVITGVSPGNNITGFAWRVS